MSNLHVTIRKYNIGKGLKTHVKKNGCFCRWMSFVSPSNILTILILQIHLEANVEI